MIFLRRYWTRPYKGDFSSYCCITPRTSCTPPEPFFSNSTVSRLAYRRRYLERPVSEWSKGRIEVQGRDVPSSSFSERGLVRFSDHSRIQSIQGHLSAFSGECYGRDSIRRQGGGWRAYKGGRDAQVASVMGVLSKQSQTKKSGDAPTRSIHMQVCQSSSVPRGICIFRGEWGQGKVVERSESCQAPDAALDKGRPLSLQTLGRPNRN